MKMKKELALSRNKTNPVLLSALALLAEYTKVTGVKIDIYDHNYTIIPEAPDIKLHDNNTCSCCQMQHEQTGAEDLKCFPARACKEMHIDAMKESQELGTSRIYSCPRGFTFWISPIYSNGCFTGTLLGGGLLQEESWKTEALAELMFICAQSVSVGNKGSHEAIKRRMIQQSELYAKIEELKNQYAPGGVKPEYPLEKEQKLLDSLRHGDIVSGRHLLNEILASIFSAEPNRFKNVRYRAIELVVLLSRVGVSSGFTAKSMLENSSRYITLIQETANIRELSDTMYRIFDDLAEQILSFRGAHHISALKKAEDFILKNLSRKISLEETARVSGFSAPYFSTLFKEEMGENLSSYLNRLRVEKAAALLLETNLSLYVIAGSCGFEDQSWFSKIFKHYTGTSPGKYRSQGGRLTPKLPGAVFSSDYPESAVPNKAY